MDKIKNEKGSITILVLFVTVGIIAVMGMGVDYSIAVYEDIHLSNALDAAALAGAMELPDTVVAEQVAESYLQQNEIPLEDVIISFSSDQMQISIQANTTVEHFLISIVGINQSTIEEVSKANIQTVGKVYDGVRPFGVVDQNFTYGEEITLKVNAGESAEGNFGALQLGDTSGASIFREYVLYGYDGTLEVGDIISTEPGNMSMIINPLRQMINSSGETFENFERSSNRVWTIPVLTDFEVNGRSDVEIIGFAKFYINDIGKQSGQTQITGRFIEYVTNGETHESALNYGLYTTKLIE